MMSDDAHQDRLAELLAAAELNDLTSEERAELDELLVELDHADSPEVLGELLVMLDQQGEDQEELPEQLQHRLLQSGRAFIASKHSATSDSLKLSDAPKSNPPTLLRWTAGLAALIAIGAGIFAFSIYSNKVQSEVEYENRLASLQEQIDENVDLLNRARVAEAEATRRVEDLDNQLTQAETRVAAAESVRLDLAQQLADATMNLHDAQLKIAKYEQPTDPAVLAERRQQLLEVPDTIQIAWQPFDLPDAPAEQPGVQGDVVWSDELQQGYIRFVGLEPNDPDVEQYQVWVIDERGLEQKVSGGVFNASADGEIIVPIEPGIDVGRVALFAITVENPGGTWVPDLERRVVVAPRDS